MKLSARNQLPGTVKSVNEGDAIANVELDVNGQRLVASITVEAAASSACRRASRSRRSSRPPTSSSRRPTDRRRNLAARRLPWAAISRLPRWSGKTRLECTFGRSRRISAAGKREQGATLRTCFDEDQRSCGDHEQRRSAGLLSAAETGSLGHAVDPRLTARSDESEQRPTHDTHSRTATRS